MDEAFGGSERGGQRSRRIPTGVPNLPPTAAAVAVTLVGMLAVYLLGGLVVQVRAELDVGRTGLGTLVATFFAGVAVGSLLGGGSADQLGPARVMRAAAVVGVLALLGAATAPPGPCCSAPRWPWAAWPGERDSRRRTR
ncbi:MAG: hypothetical protein LH469_08415 [Frankiaceae bacterium]|nr:hypothetical protein [Frankiaceae bacterium]